MAGQVSALPVLPLVESDEHQALRASVRGIASKFGPRYMAERVAADEPPTELWDALASHGFLGVNLPERYDGGGLGLAELAIVEEEASACGCPLFMLLVSPAIVGTILARHGTEEQRDVFLRGIATGQEICAFGITEPDAGSNSHSISTRAVRDGDVYRLTGTKTYISGLEQARWTMVVARDEHGLCAFILDSEGIERQPIPTAVAMPETQYTLFFDEHAVDADRRIPGDGLALLFDGLNPERILAAAICSGVGRYALARASEYAKSRAVWRGQPIGAHQGIAHPLAEACIGIESARLMTMKAALLHDAGANAGEASNMAKFLAADAGLKAIDQAIQVHGGNGFAREYGLTDLYFVVRLLKTAPVSREMILNYVAQHSLGLPRSY